MYLLTEPRIFWFPLVLIVSGLLHYVYRKYWFPLSERTINELDRKSLFGWDGYRERPQVGIETAIVGLIIFVVFNLESIQYYLSQWLK